MVERKWRIGASYGWGRYLLTLACSAWWPVRVPIYDSFLGLLGFVSQLAMPLHCRNLSAPYPARDEAWSYQSGDRDREELRCLNVPPWCFWVFFTQLPSLVCEEGVGWVEVDCRKGKVRDGK